MEIATLKGLFLEAPRNQILLSIIRINTIHVVAVIDLTVAPDHQKTILGLVHSRPYVSLGDRVRTGQPLLDQLHALAAHQVESTLVKHAQRLGVDELETNAANEERLELGLATLQVMLDPFEYGLEHKQLTGNIQLTIAQDLAQHLHVLELQKVRRVVHDIDDVFDDEVARVLGQVLCLMHLGKVEHIQGVIQVQMCIHEVAACG